MVLHFWAHTGAAPKALTILSAVASLIGVILVIEPTRVQDLNALGLVFSFLAAVAMAAYFFVSAHPSENLPPLTLLAFGLMTGGIITTLLGVTGLLPFTMTFENAAVTGQHWPW